MFNSTFFRKVGKELSLLAFLFLIAVRSMAQVTVTGDASGSYPDLAAAITAVNGVGTLTQNTTISITAGNPQTAPVSGYSITATGTASFSLTLTGNGNTITAGLQPSGSLIDGIFKIIGGDYITIQGFTMQENASNVVTTPSGSNTMTEWGVALLYASTSNGAQNNTIQNNTISLNRNYANSVAIYSNTQHAAATPGVGAQAGAGGGNINNKFYTNTIGNVNMGFILVSSSTAAAFGTGNDIGGTSAGQGNTITNWGSNAATSGFTGVSGTNFAIYLNHETGYNLRFNTITSATVAPISTLQGIFSNYNTTQPSGTFTNTISDNTVTLTNSGTSANIAINNIGWTTALATGNTTIANNSIINCSVGSGGLTGIVSLNAAGVVNINSNIIRSNTITATTGAYTGIQQTGAVQTTLNINNNQLGNASGGFITYSAANSSALTGITNTGGAATCAVSISSNDIRGITHSVAGSSAHTYFSNTAAAPASFAINNNTFTNLNVNTTGSVTFLAHTGTFAATVVSNMNNNSIVTAYNKAGAGGTITIRTSSSSTPAGAVVNFQNNNFSNMTFVSGTFDGYFDNDGGAPTKGITGNTFNNINMGTGSVTRVLGAGFNGNNTSISNNTISNISAGGAIVCIALIGSGTSTAQSCSNNTIFGIASTGTGGAVTAITTAANATTTTYTRNKIYDLSTTNATALVSGILISGGLSGGTQLVSNNLIGDLRSPNGSNGTTDVIRGINITSATTTSNINVYHNTVYIAGSGGANFTTSGIFHTTSTTATTARLDIRNNIIYNVATPSGTGLSIAYRRSLGTANNLANYNSASNNNMFYAGTPGASNLIYFDGTSSAQTIAAYRSGVFTAGTIAPRDAASVSEAIAFVSLAGANANFLRYPLGTPHLVEQGGATGTGITDDYAATTRCPGGGCPGAGSFPDIGAWELAGTLSADNTGPTITYTPLSNSACVGSVSLTATITDASLVNGTAGTRPRLYYKKSTDANTYAGNTSGDNGWKFVEATGATTPFTFNLNAGLLQSAIVSGDVIQYFVVAQDLAGTPNVGINSGTFAAAPSSVALTSAAFPLGGSINSYSIINSLPATINLPADYPTLTGAGGLFAALNAAALSANTVVNINANITTENGANALNQIVYGCGGPFTLTIKPTGAARTVSGANAGAALIRLNGADNVIIDGSTSGGTDRSLTITNTGTTASTTAIQLISLGLGAGATDNTIKNCNISTGSVAVATTYGISVGSTIGTSGADNDNTTIQNNSFTTCLNPVYAFGTTAVSAGGNNNLSITGNTIVINATIATPYGIRVGGGLGSSISQNSIDIVTSATGQPVGISVETDFVSSTVSRNNIIRVVPNGTGGFGGRGITVGTGTASSALTISNNMISGINGDNWSAFGNSSSAGIWIGVIGNSGTLTTTTGGVNLYYNSIHMAGTYTRASTAVLTAAMYVGSGATALDVRNNIFSNSLQNISGTAGACKNYAIYSAAAPAAFTTLNNNDYYGVTTANNTFVTGFISAADQSTFANWQTATGKEAAGQNVDPQFQANNDLHIQPSSTNVNGLGATGTGVTVDFDNDPRSGSPDIGADEYTPCSPPSVSITPSGTTVCNPNPSAVTLTAVGTGTKVWYNGSPGTYTGLFRNAGLSTAYTGQNDNVVYVGTAGTYTLRLDDAGCFATTTQTITTVTGVTLPALTNSGPVCPGSSATITSNASFPTSAGTYNFSASAGTYTPISGTTLLGNSGSTNDDNQSGAVALPFTFTLAGVAYTHFNACVNGWMRLGTNASVSSTNPTSMSSTFTNAIGNAVNTQLLAPMWDDLYILGNNSDKVHYSVSGSSPNQVLTVEWFGVKRNGSGGTTQNFQVKLYENGNVVQFVYGACVAPTSTSASCGITDNVGGSGRYLSVNDFSLGAGASSVVASDAITTTASLVGLTYTFTPPPAGLTYAWVASGPPAANSDFDDQTIAVPTVGPLGADGNYPYQLTVTAGNGCQAVRTTTVVVQTTPLVVNPPTTNNNNFCYGGTATLTMTNRFSGGCPSYTYYLYANPGGQLATGTLTGPGVANTFVVTPSATSTDYTLRIVDNDGTDVTSAPLTINITNPQPLTTNAATRCGVGTTQLTGTVNGGDVLAWYTASTGGTFIGTGSPVTSPVIGSTTTFYAAAITGGSAATVGKAAPTEDGFITTNWGIQVSTSTPGLIVDATVYPYGSGTITIALQNSAGTELFATSAISVTGDGSGTTPVVLPLNFPVATGTNYRLVVKAYTGITNLRRDFAGNTYPYTGGTFSIPASWNGSATTGAYYFFYNLNVLSGCEGTRVPVVATVNPPPALTVSTDQVVCNNVTTPLSVVTGGASYNTYIWAPTTDLFTDAGATVPYTGTSATTVYAKTTTAGATTYTLTGTQTGGAQCVNTDDVVFTNQPNPTSVNPSLANICISGSVTMSLTPSTGYVPGTIQWQTGATIPLLADIGGANASSYTTPVISSGTPFYRAIVKNGLGATCAQFTVPFNVNNPQVLTSNGATRCGQGSVNLTATVNGGSTIAWFDSPTGGSQVGTSSPFPTPTITGTTTYYVAAIGSPYTFNLGLPDNTVGTYNASTASDWPVRFTTTKATKVKTVVVYPTAAGNLFVALRASGSSVDITNIGPFTLQAADIGNPVLLTLDISIPTPGDYQLTGLSTGPGRIGRMSALVGTPYPFLSPDGSVSVYGSATSSTTAVGSFSTTTYNSFFNIEFESACESGRTPVVATVTPAPALNPPAASPATVCAGDPTILSITSGNAGYTYTWQPGALVGSTQSVSPSSTIVYTVNAQDNSGGPNNGCFNTAQIQVNVNPVPSAATVNVTAPGLVCGGTVKTLAATANTAATYSFGTQASTNTASTTAAGYPGPYSVYYGGQRMQMLIRASELSGSGFVAGSQLTSIAFTVVSKGSNNPSNISFQMNIGHTALNGLAANGFQGGLTNVVPAATYNSVIGLNTHTFSSPFIWNGIDNIVLETTFGNSITGTTNDWIESYYSPTSFVSTIVYRGDGATNGSPAFCASATNTSFIYSARPDFTLNGSLGATSITWTPIANLFTDAGATSAYVGNTNFPTVYSKMNTTTSVNARVTLTATGCYTDAPVSLLYTPRPTVDISANEFVCEDQSAPVNFFFTGTGPWDMTYNIGGGPITQNGIATSPIDIPYLNATTSRTYTVTALSDASGCTSLPEDLDALTLIVPIPCEISWNGSQSNDWSDKDNWTPNNSAPSQFTSVRIPSNVPNQPLVSGSTFAANVNFLGTPVPTIGAGGVLNIKGNIVGSNINATTILGAGKVALNGTGLQTISGKLTVPNLDLGNTSAQGVVVSPAAVLKVDPVAATNSGLVTLLNNSRLTINGSFVLGSNAIATAKIGPVPATFTLTGDVTQERWLPYTSSTGGSWNFIASPFSGKNFTNWVDDFKVVGLNTGFGPQGSGIINSNEPERSTVFHYDEPTHDTRLDTVQKQGWRIPGNVNIAPGKGYRVWVDHYSNGTHKFNNQGSFVFGDFNFPTLNRTELAGCIPATFPCDEPSLRGWNLVANPYPCDIDWDATGGAWTKPIQMSNAWYRWHAAASGYGVYTSGLYAGTTPEPANPNLIPSSQAFFVRLGIGGTYNATLAVKETAKVTATSGQFVRTNVTMEKIRITISKPNVVNGYSTVVRFMDGATDGFDFAYDFSSLGGSGFNIGIPVDNDLLSIASFAPIAEYKVIPLTIRYNGNLGSYNLKFSDMATLLENNLVFLRDNLENTLTPVTEGSQYAFGVSALDGMLGNRFELVFNPQSITSTIVPVSNKLGMTVYPNPNFAGKATTISLVGFDAPAVNIRIVDALGRNVFSTKVAVKSEGITEYTLIESLPAGMYTIQTSGGNQTLIQKLVVK